MLLLLTAGLLAVLAPNLLVGYEVRLFGEAAAVPTFRTWPLPALEVALSPPPMTEAGAFYAWAAEQLAAVLYGLAVLLYYVGLAGLAVGGGLVGLALRRFSRSADTLGR